MPLLNIADNVLLYPELHKNGSAADVRPSGVIKRNSADFIVHEIDRDGKRVPFQPVVVSTESNRKRSAGDDTVPNADEQGFIPPIAHQALTEFLHSTSLERFAQYYADRFNRKPFHEDSTQRTIQVAPIKEMTKSDRTRLHSVIREDYPLVTSETTKSETGMILFVIRPLTKRDTHRSEAPNRPAYTHFTLRKENIDTSRAMAVLARVLHAHPRTFTFAGTKDKRAITFQRVSARGIEWKRIASVNHSSNIQVSDPSGAATQLFLGDLTGNHFTIKIRQVTQWGAPQEDKIRCIGGSGFVNYYGPQRFGSGGCATHSIGVHVVNGEYSVALAMILRSRTEFSPEFQRCAREVSLVDLEDNVKEGIDSASTRYQEMLRECPKECRLELSILETLAEQPRNYTAAWMRIPRNSRRLYTHALQSFVWNDMVSRRLEAHGTSVVVGDIVRVKNDTEAPLVSSTGGENDDEERVCPDYTVTQITKENIGQFSMLDVVMPLPGSDAKLVYPCHSCGREEYHDALRQRGAERLLDECEESGGYRHVLIQPTDIECAVEEEIVSDGGNALVVSLQFGLPKGCYATALLREVVRWT